MMKIGKMLTAVFSAWLIVACNKSECVEELVESFEPYSCPVDDSQRNGYPQKYNFRSHEITPEKAKQFSYYYEMNEIILPNKKPKKIETTPDIAIQFGTGWLVGSDRGEWGGELVHISEDGTRRELLKGWVSEIYWQKYGYLVLTGIGHMFVEEGDVYLIKGSETNQPVVEHLFKLPGFPYWSCPCSDDCIYLRCQSNNLDELAPIKTGDELTHYKHVFKIGPHGAVKEMKKMKIEKVPYIKKETRKWTDIDEI